MINKSISNSLGEFLLDVLLKSPQVHYSFSTKLVSPMNEVNFCNKTYFSQGRTFALKGSGSIKMRTYAKREGGVSKVKFDVKI